VAMFVSAAKDDEEGKLAKAERAARMAGVSVRTWMARLTLSERTLVVDFIVAVVGARDDILWTYHRCCCS